MILVVDIVGKPGDAKRTVGAGRAAGYCIRVNPLDASDWENKARIVAPPTAVASGMRGPFPKPVCPFVRIFEFRLGQESAFPSCGRKNALNFECYPTGVTSLAYEVVLDQNCSTRCQQDF